MLSFVQQQQKTLKNILKQGAKTSVFAHFGLQKTHQYKDFDLMYREFSDAVSVYNVGEWWEEMRGLVRDGQVSPTEIASRPQMLAGQPPLGLAEYNQHWLPFGAGVAHNFLQAEKKWRAMLKQAGCKLKGKPFYCFYTTQGQHFGALDQADMHMLLEEQRQGWWRHKSLPTTNALKLVGNSRHQWLNALIEELKKCGKEVDTLVAPPSVLVDMSLFMAQQEGRFVPLKELCPNLEALVYNGLALAPYRLEIKYLFKGFPQLKWLQCYYNASGLMSLQADFNLRQRLSLEAGEDVFYEFVPVEDVSPDGRFYRHYRRLHAGQVERQKIYLVLVSNTSGVLALNTGLLVKVLSDEPFHFSWLGRVERLNDFGENLAEYEVNGVIDAMNEALSAHGVFIREYMVGNNVQEKRPRWVLELSRPLEEVDPVILQSMVKRLHVQLESENSQYAQVFQRHIAENPEINVVPMGTFAALPQGTQAQHFDFTPDAERVTQVLATAWQKKTFSPN